MRNACTYITSSRCARCDGDYDAMFFLSTCVRRCAVRSTSPAVGPCRRKLAAMLASTRVEQEMCCAVPLAIMCFTCFKAWFIKRPMLCYSTTWVFWWCRSCMCTSNLHMCIRITPPNQTYKYIFIYNLHVHPYTNTNETKCICIDIYIYECIYMYMYV